MAWYCWTVASLISIFLVDLFLRWSGLYKAFATEIDYPSHNRDWMPCEDHFGFVDQNSALIGNYTLINKTDSPSFIVNVFFQRYANYYKYYMHGAIVGIHAGDGVTDPYFYVLTGEYWPDSHNRYSLQRKRGTFGVYFGQNFPIRDSVDLGTHEFANCEWIYRNLEYDSMFLNCSWDLNAPTNAKERAEINRFLSKIEPIEIDFDFDFHSINSCDNSKCDIYYYFVHLWGHDYDRLITPGIFSTKAVPFYTHVGLHVKDFLLLYDIDIYDYVGSYLAKKLGIDIATLRRISGFKTQGKIDSVSEDGKILYHHNMQTCGMVGDIVLSKTNDLAIGIVKRSKNDFFSYTYPKNMIYTLQNSFIKASMNRIYEDLNDKKKN